MATTLFVPVLVVALGLAYALSYRRRRPLATAKMEKS